MLIIAGHLIVDPAEREAFVAEGAQNAVAPARRAAGCLDFAMTADSLDPARINVFERWRSEQELSDFRGAGPDSDTAAQILGADVKRYVVAAVMEP